MIAFFRKISECIYMKLFEIETKVKVGKTESTYRDHYESNTEEDAFMQWGSDCDSNGIDASKATKSIRAFESLESYMKIIQNRKQDAA